MIPKEPTLGGAPKDRRPHQAYSTFPDQITAAARARALVNELSELGRLICDFNGESKFGICLLHSHFPMWEDEKLLSRRVGDGYFSEVAVEIPASAKPSAWRSYGGTSEVIEYSTDVDLAAECPIQLLDAFCKVAQKLGVDDLFGLAFVGVTKQAQPERTLLEVTDERQRCMLTMPVPSKELSKHDDIVSTQWRFGRMADTTIVAPVQACWYGSSRCCCGSDSVGHEILAKYHPEQLRHVHFSA